MQRIHLVIQYHKKQHPEVDFIFSNKLKITSLRHLGFD